MSYESSAIRIFSLAAILAVSCLCVQADNGSGGVGASEIFQQDAASGLTLGGFDPVSYFLPEGPQAGRSDLEFVWGGVAWRFAREANRAAFESAPAAYAPRIGGYDAQAASGGRVVDASPFIFVIVRNRLYLFRNDANRARFLSDESRALESERQWAELRQGLVKP